VAEEEFVLFLGIMFDGNEPVFRDVFNRAHRSWKDDPALPRSERQKRRAKLKRLMKSLTYVTPQPGRPVVPYRTPGGLIAFGSPAFKMESGVRHTVGEKLARAVLWEEAGRTLPADIIFKAKVGSRPDGTTEDERKTWMSLVEGMNSLPINNRSAPVLRYRFREAETVQDVAGWFFRLWDALDFWVFTRQPGE
jgi:hypothetical protein